MKTFEQIVQSMAPSEIIQSMIDSLKNPYVAIDMDTYGRSRFLKCYGCAATNTLCRISGIKLQFYSIDSVESRAKAVNADRVFLANFESAIDCLRQGYVEKANRKLKTINVDPIKRPDSLELPRLMDNYTDQDLQQYEALADYNKIMEQLKTSTIEVSEQPSGKPKVCLQDWLSSGRRYKQTIGSTLTVQSARWNGPLCAYKEIELAS